MIGFFRILRRLPAKCKICKKRWCPFYACGVDLIYGPLSPATSLLHELFD